MFEVKNLYYNLNGNAFFEGISFFAKVGEITTILGESGAGKSTFLGLCSGNLSPVSGLILINGVEQPDYSKKLIPGNPQIKVVNQKNDLFPNISLDENLKYKLRFYKKEFIERRTKSLKKAFKIDHLSDRLPKEVSGGELQRWQIACAIAEKPAVLLLDEPFSNLDPENKFKMKEILEKVTLKESIITIMVSHDVNDSFGMSSKIYVLKKGKFIQNGNILDVYAKPKNPYVSNLTGMSNILGKKEAQLLFAIEKNVMVRPEWIEFTKKGQFEANIVSSKYFPPYYQIKIEINSLKFICFSAEEKNIGEKYLVNIKYYTF